MTQSVVVTRSAYRPVSTGLGRPMLQIAMRYSSTADQEAKQAYQAMMDAKHALQRDWDAKELSYEELKPRVLHPRAVSIIVLYLCRDVYAERSFRTRI